jgi:hypothetical protein
MLEMVRILVLAELQLILHAAGLGIIEHSFCLMSMRSGVSDHQRNQGY